MKLLNFALRNVAANKRRSLFVIVLIGISVCALLVMDAFVTRVYWGVASTIHAGVKTSPWSATRFLDLTRFMNSGPQPILSIVRYPEFPSMRSLLANGLVGCPGQSIRRDTTKASPKWGIGVTLRQNIGVKCMSWAYGFASLFLLGSSFG